MVYIILYYVKHHVTLVWNSNLEVKYIIIIVIIIIIIIIIISPAKLGLNAVG